MHQSIRLVQVDYIPDVLDPGNLYVAEEFGAAVHLCACGCAAKIRTPLGPTDWSLEITPEGPSLFPSVGNWQQACQSHYWIYRGRIVVAPRWSREEIAQGRQAEEARHRRYFEQSGADRKGFNRFWQWLLRKFRRQ